MTDFASAAQVGTNAAQKKKRSNKGKGITKLEDVDNLLVPGRVECECQGKEKCCYI